jgi:hypothetical protein
MRADQNCAQEMPPQGFRPMNSNMIIATLMPPAAPETVPTVLIRAAGSLDREAMDLMKTRKAGASTINATPTMTNRQLVRRMVQCSCGGMPAQWSGPGNSIAPEWIPVRGALTQAPQLHFPADFMISARRVGF